MYRKNTGVMYSVRSCEKSSPPTTARPSGRRAPPPAPQPSAIGMRGHQRRHRRHHDRPEPDQARLVDRFERRLAFAALRLEGEVNHHDAVLLHQADEHDDADEGVQAQVHAEDQQRQQRADAGDGRPERIVSGWMKLSYRTPRTM